ncbi:unnamed protein product [Phytophthora fragariaefolia]|uniref:Unnamed protein product n=1 Tax=Phytophthora fragariaefolia TaxID=1490495 RepID=A0A9W6X5E9_9STRA|nr:unnamed protein product [Phytophthora fragariaefolia]
MADALEGGKAVPANACHALFAFVRNTYPKFTDFLETKISLEDDKPEHQLKVAVAALVRKAETDGRLPDRKKTNAAPPAAATTKNKNTTPVNKKPQQMPMKSTKNPKKRSPEPKLKLRSWSGRRSRRSPTPTPRTRSSAMSAVQQVTLLISAALTCKVTRRVSLAEVQRLTLKPRVSVRTMRTTNVGLASGDAVSCWTR